MHPAHHRTCTYSHMVHYPYASWSHAAGCPQAIWEQYVLILHSTLPLTLQLGHKSCQASKKFVYLILHVCVYIFHAPCMTLSYSTALYGSVFVNCEMLVWTTCWYKTVMPVWRWQQSQFFHCGHNLTGEVTIGHSLNILLRLHVWMPRWLDHLEG